MITRESVTLHFDLSHCPTGQEFTLHAAGKTYGLQQHSAASLRLHGQTNGALALVPEEQRSRVTHFIANIDVPGDAVGLHWVSFPAKNPDDLLPELATVFFHIPESGRRRALRKHLPLGEREVPESLACYGVSALPDHTDQEHHQLHLDAAKMIGPGAAARAIVAHHPDIASLKPEVAGYVHHIIDRTLLFDHSLRNYISYHGPDSDEPWYQKGVCQANGKPVIPYEGPDIKDKDGNLIHWPKQNGQSVIPQYHLSPGLVGDESRRGAATHTVQKVIRTVKADKSLKGELWSVHPGVTARQRINGPQSSPLKTNRSLLDSGAAQDQATSGDEPTHYKWASGWLTTSYGLDFDTSSLEFDFAANRMYFRVKNWANRALSVYVEFADESGTPIENPAGWEDPVPADFKASASKRFVESILSGNTVFGIPVPTDYVGVKFEVPTKATAVRVLFGGLGHGHYDADVDKIGIILTCVLNYGIPSFLMAASVGLQSTAFYMDLMDNPQTKYILLATAAPLFAGLIGGAAVKMNTKMVLFKAAEFIGGIIFAAGLRFLTMRILGYVSGAQLMESAPFVGWALRIASCAAAIDDMEATTIAVAASPSTYWLQVKRAMDVHVTVRPDPIHGTATQPPIWPAVATHYLIRISYRLGNHYEITGQVPVQQDDPIIASWENLPSAPDESIQITAILYSSNNWIAGKWVSGWQKAAPSAGSTLSVKGSIIEVLVPLDQNTEYNHNRRLLLGAAGKLEWAIAGQPAEMIQDIGHCTDDGHNLCKCVSITINNRAYALGYTWRASGQSLPLDNGATPLDVQMYAFQGISVLADPTAEMKAPQIGFSRPAHLLYDQFGPLSLFSVDKKFQADLDGGTISQELRDLFASAGQQYVVPEDATVTQAGTSGTEWTIGEPGLPALYELQLVSLASQSTIHVLEYASGRFLFSLPSRYKEQLASGVISSDLRAAFAASSSNFALPADAAAAVSQATARWYISSGGTNLYDLRRDVDSIGVFHYPAPAFSTNNFYLDPRGGSGGKNYHVRHVDLSPTAVFNYDAATSWGTFANSDLDAAVVHPSGYIVAVSYDNHKMELLRLPAAAVPAAEAEPATLVSGKGLREGLLQHPVALTVAPDGRILVLEQGNGRIQAFDIAGNAVQSFAGALQVTIDLDLDKYLDRNEGAAVALQAAYQSTVPAQVAHRFAFPFAENTGNSLDLEAIRRQFVNHGFAFTGDSFEVHATSEKLWLIKNTTRKLLFDMRQSADGSELEVFDAPTLHIEVKRPGQDWIIRDKASATVFEVDVHEQRLRLRQLIATMPLYDPLTADVTYLDVGVETQSFIYVLSYVNGGDQLSDYHLDLYSPDGTHLSRTPKDPAAPGVNAAKLVVDQWRNMYTLNFQTIQDASGRTQPSVSRWIPSTPQDS